MLRKHWLHYAGLRSHYVHDHSMAHVAFAGKHIQVARSVSADAGSTCTDSSQDKWNPSQPGSKKKRFSTETSTHASSPAASAEDTVLLSRDTLPNPPNPAVQPKMQHDSSAVSQHRPKPTGNQGAGARPRNKQPINSWWLRNFMDSNYALQYQGADDDHDDCMHQPIMQDRHEAGMDPKPMNSKPLCGPQVSAGKQRTSSVGTSSGHATNSLGSGKHCNLPRHVGGPRYSPYTTGPLTKGPRTTGPRTKGLHTASVGNIMRRAQDSSSGSQWSEEEPAHEHDRCHTMNAPGHRTEQYLQQGKQSETLPRQPAHQLDLTPEHGSEREKTEAIREKTPAHDEFDDEAMATIEDVIVAKALTRSDASTRRVILPRIAVEANLPEAIAVMPPGGSFPLNAVDKHGRLWDLVLQAWSNGHNPKPVYVLEHVSEYMKMYGLREGDIIGVCRCVHAFGLARGG